VLLAEFEVPPCSGPVVFVPESCGGVVLPALAVFCDGVAGETEARGLVFSVELLSPKYQTQINSTALQVVTPAPMRTMLLRGVAALD
jgi:hypothetical protein